MDKKELELLMELHREWLESNGRSGNRLVLPSGANLSGANLSEANLSDANLSYANMRLSNLDMSSWPLSCGGTMARIDRRLTVQLIYHAYNQYHQDDEIKKALEPIRKYAQEFIDLYRKDAPKLREKLG